MTKAAATTSPPERRISSIAASAVPPVAIRSSTSSTRVALADRVGVNLDRVDAVFEAVFLADRPPGQLALLADRHEAAAELMGDGAAEDEAARLDAGDMVDAGAGERAARSPSTAARRPAGSAISVVMSRNRMPGLG